MPVSLKHLKECFSKDHANMNLFAKWPVNDLYYQVRLLKLDEKKEKCSVKYEDNTEVWVHRRDLHLQFDSPESPYSSDEDIFCCLCDDGTSNAPNEVIICDVCQQGYHQRCHKPKIRQAEVEDETEEWSCHTCSYILTQLDPEPNTSTPKIKKGRKKTTPRRAIAKASRARLSSIKLKLSKEKKGKKSSQESQSSEARKVKARSVTPIPSPDVSDEASMPGDSSQESLPEPPPPPASDKRLLFDNKQTLIETAKKIESNVGTKDFAEAVTAKSTNGKISKRAPAKNGKANRVAVPPA